MLLLYEFGVPNALDKRVEAETYALADCIWPDFRSSELMALPKWLQVS